MSAGCMRHGLRRSISYVTIVAPKHTLYDRTSRVYVGNLMLQIASFSDHVWKGRQESKARWRRQRWRRRRRRRRSRRRQKEQILSSCTHYSCIAAVTGCAATVNISSLVCCRTQKPRCLWARVGCWFPALEARSSMQQRIQFAS